MNVKDLHKLINANQLTLLFLKPNKKDSASWKNGIIPKKYLSIIKQFDKDCKDFEQKVIELYKNKTT